MLLFSSCCSWCGRVLRERTQLPLPTARAPSETEGAGPNGRGLSSYSESRFRLVKWTRPPLFVRKGALFFWTVHGPFSFRQDEKKMGGGTRPSRPGARNLPSAGVCKKHFMRRSAKSPRPVGRAPSPSGGSRSLSTGSPRTGWPPWPGPPGPPRPARSPAPARPPPWGGSGGAGG